MFPQEQMESGKIGDQDKKKKREQLCQGFERLCVCVYVCVLKWSHYVGLKK